MTRCLPLTLWTARAEQPWIDSDPLVAKTLRISSIERARLIGLEQEGTVTIRPVALPRGKYLRGNNRMLGWPVGTRVGSTLLVVYHQWLTHIGRPRQDALSSDAIVIRSTDGGHTWSSPIDIRQFGVNRNPTVMGFGNCLGVLNGKVFLATNYGVYRSEDEGRSWQLIPDVLTQQQTGITVSDSFGPRMIIHPEKGLVIPVTPQLHQPYMDVYSSQDDGKTWNRERVTLSNSFNPVEPTGLYHNGRLIFLTRNHTLPIQGQKSALSRPALLVSDDKGWLSFEHRGLTNISSYRWPDTTDLDFNPVTHRYEAIVSNRSGGVGADERNETHEQTINLWSIPKQDLINGSSNKWQFETTLLRLKSGWLKQSGDDIDAAHPAGAVIDLERNLQHVFIYAGTFGMPCGIYRISRTLDTPRLRTTNTVR